MKRLVVEYDGRALFDGEIQEFNWTETGNGIKVEGKIRKSAGGAGGGLLEALAAVSKSKTGQRVEQGHADLAADMEDDSE